MKQQLFILSCIVLLLSASALAADINLIVEPAGILITPNDNMLLVFIEPNDINLLAATAVFRISGGFAFVDNPNLINSGRIFTPLDTNQLISGAWTMDGTAAGGMAVTISNQRRLLGQIKVSAPASGSLQLELDRSASEFWESRTVRHTLGEVTIASVSVGGTGGGAGAVTVNSVLTQIRVILEDDSLRVIQKVSAIARILQESNLII